MSGKGNLSPEKNQIVLGYQCEVCLWMLEALTHSLVRCWTDVVILRDSQGKLIDSLTMQNSGQSPRDVTHSSMLVILDNTILVVPDST